MVSSQPDKVISWLSTVGCVLLAARCAPAFAGSNPRVFTIFSLLALSWALLMPYYNSTPADTEMLPALNGFVLFYVGLLLSREAKSNRDKQQGASPLGAGEVSILESLTVWLLAVLAAPSFLSFTPESEYLPKIELTIGTVWTLLGLYSVGSGMRKYLEGDRLWLVMGALVLLGWSLEVWYWYSAIRMQPVAQEASRLSYWKIPSTPPMTMSLRYLFSVTKVLFTSAFIGLVLWKLLPADQRNPWRILLRILGVVSG